MADHLKRAMENAHDRGMKLVQCRTDAGLARVACTTCGWPQHLRLGAAPADEYDVLIERYALAPHGCHPCRWSAEHGRPCPGHAQPQNRAQ